MRRLFVLVILLTIVAAAPGAQRAAQSEPTRLPVRRVILYKTGVGYFEHLGSITGSGDVEIQFTSGQLDDVLTSLTAIDLDHGQIGSITYNSAAPVAQRLAALHLPLGANPDTRDLYRALRGAHVEVRTGTSSIQGRLLNVERKSDNVKGDAVEVDLLMIAGDDGTLRTVRLGPDVTVHLGDKDVREDLGRYLGVVASARAQDARRMVLSATGTGTRRLFVSYISEVPVWKSTYRLVLPGNDTDKPLLQGWAIVDNTIGEDWNDVELSLVAGAPHSFIEALSQPYYARRPVVPLPATAQLAPQTHAPTLQGGNGVVRGTVRDSAGAALPGVTVRLTGVDDGGSTAGVTDATGSYVLDAPPGTYRLTFDLPGFRAATRTVALTGGGEQTLNVPLEVGGPMETVTVAGQSPAASPSRTRATPRARVGGGTAGGFIGGMVGGLPEPPPPPVDMLQQMAATPAATPQDLGELFEYRIAQPITILENQSALVPIVNAKVEAERVSLWNRGAGSGRPLRAIWLTNATPLTLDGGTFSVIDANAFAGEGLMDPVKPGERRLVSYATDLGVMVEAHMDDASGHYTRITAHDGIVVASQEQRQHWMYRLRNEDTTRRTIVIEHPLSPGWTVEADPKPAETTSRSARFRVPLDAKKEATLAITAHHAGETRYDVGNLDNSVITMFEQTGVPSDALRAALAPLLDARKQLAASEDRLGALTNQVNTITRDQDRLRENMKALRGSDEEKQLLQRYTHELGDQEDQLANLRRQIAETTAERDRRQAALSRVVAGLTFDVQGR
ncbi:MAG TPA: carboxypeptidase regulatory-like domain-containing protein [Vicinamibacterales bacterium]|nr:carboxypeptidase regulatory-like domain-containing protein [Vicinamibacterales bacterium]